MEVSGALPSDRKSAIFVNNLNVGGGDWTFNTSNYNTTRSAPLNPHTLAPPYRGVRHRTEPRRALQDVDRAPRQR